MKPRAAGAGNVREPAPARRSSIFGKGAPAFERCGVSSCHGDLGSSRALADREVAFKIRADARAGAVQEDALVALRDAEERTGFLRDPALHV